MVKSQECPLGNVKLSRCNTSLLVDYFWEGDGSRTYVLIDMGKTFREQVLRWFTFHRIPRVDSVSFFFFFLFFGFIDFVLLLLLKRLLDCVFCSGGIGVGT